MSTSNSRSPHRTPGLRRYVLLLSLLACSLPATRAHALLTPDKDTPRTIHVYAVWNSEYLNLAARVPDTILTGSSTAPMSAPQQDDAVEFDLSIPVDTGIVAHRLIISAAGGMTLLTRDARGNWRSDTAWTRGPRTLKYAVNVVGTLNNPRDVDTEFVVELAIPWDFLGGAPRGQREFGFNVVNWMQGENEAIVSWSPVITTPEQIGDTALGGHLGLTPTPTLVAAKGLYAIAPTTRVQPFIDGALSAQEWMTAGTLSFEKPEPALTPTPAAGNAKAKPFGALLALYRYDWEPALLWQADGAPATPDQPREAAGPWYSYARVAWHRQQLAEVKRSGIDIVLAQYRGDAASRQRWARVGLDRLTQALKEMRAEGASYPLVGMYLDTTPLAGVDLKTDAGKQLVYGMIRDFYLHLPREFRAELAALPAEGAPGGLVVMLGDPAGLKDWDAGFLQYVSERLGPIAWVGSPAWREKGATGFHAYLRSTPTGPAPEEKSGALAFTISPGACPAVGTGGEVSPRQEMSAYRRDWQRLLTASPELVVIDSWNDFARGTEVGPSRQYGFVYGDYTRAAKAQLGSRQGYSLRLLQQSVPKVLAPGRDYFAEFVAENNGLEDVTTGRKITADYRITRRSDGKVVLNRVAAQELSVLAGQIKRFPVTIPTRDSQDRPLDPGEYTFSLVVIKSKVAMVRSSLAARAEAVLSVPITIGTPPAHRATVLSTSLPATLASGATEKVWVRLRNDGADTWRARETGVSYLWMRHDDDLATEGPERTMGPGHPAALPRDVAPGQVVSVEVPVTVEGTGEEPLPPSQASDAWHYRLKWDVLQNGASFLAAGEPLSDEAVQVVAADRGAVVRSAGAPASITASGTLEVPVAVANHGSRPWAASEVAVVCSWYRWDGRAEVATSAAAPIPVSVAPGDKATVLVKLVAPAAAGPYRLVWRAIDGAAQAVPPVDAQSGQDLLVAPILVKGGVLRAVDLSSFTNVVAITTESYRGRGDADGSGRSLPAEYLPPDQSGGTEGLYPGGYYAPGAAPTTVPFAYPGAATGLGGAVACNGQTIVLGERGVVRLHLLVSAVNGAQPLTVTLTGAGSPQEVTLNVPSWTEPAGASVGASTPFLRGLNGEEATQQGYLHHLVIEPAAGSSPTALVLPKAPSVLVFAITVEDQPAPAGG